MSVPVIAGFYPDPSICRGADAYYTAHSSFEYAPGVPIFRSTDLTAWTQVGNALDRPDQLPNADGAANSGIYAPTIRYFEGTYWLVTTNIGLMRQGQLLVHAEDPAGPWSEPVYIPGTMGIDPDLSWDEDGVCRLTWASSEATCQGLATARIDPERGVLLEEPRLIWQGTGLHAPEGPHLYRIDGWWYQLIAEGGTERGHTAAMARARSLDGPWETPPQNPILTHRSTDNPVQNVGHADLIQTPDGDWAMAYHGVRPRGVTPKFHVNGRESFIARVDWQDGWPIVREGAFDVPEPDHSFTDDFTGDTLNARWVAPGVHPEEFSAVTGDGARVAAPGEGQEAPSFLAVRARDEEWTFRAHLDPAHPGDDAPDDAPPSATDHNPTQARIQVRLNDAHWYGVTIGERTIEAQVAIGPAVATVGSIPHPGGEVEVRISARPAPRGDRAGRNMPDVVELAVTPAGADEHVFGCFDGRYLSTEVAGGFTGRVVGVEAVSGEVLVRQVSYVAEQRSGAVAGADGARYDLSATTVEALLVDPEALALIEEVIPGLSAHPYLDHLKPLTLDALVAMGGGLIQPEAMGRLRERLAALPAS